MVGLWEEGRTKCINTLISAIVFILTDKCLYSLVLVVSDPCEFNQSTGVNDTQYAIIVNL